MDITTDLPQVLKLFAEYRPEAVVHAAAYTDVDGAEKIRVKHIW